MGALDGDEVTLSLQERFQHLARLIASERFLQLQGLGNEAPFFICPHPPQEAVAMEKMVGQLAKRLGQGGVRVLAINLYDLCIELLQGVLDPANYLVPAIAARMREAPFDVLFLSGVGEVFPYIRSHNVLNNLQSTAKERPTVLFFPGKYTQTLEKGAALDLFGRLHDDKYYRAFNIYHVHA